MLTPQEILDKKFDKVMVWGYDMNGVDSFLEAVETDYAQLYKENITLKNKLKVLVTKIEEYRSVDESMRKALLGAQNMAGELVDKAKKQCEEMQQQTVGKLEGVMSSYKERITAEEMRLEEAKTGALAFIDRMLSMYEQEIRALTGLRERELAAGHPDEPLMDTVPLPQVDSRPDAVEAPPAAAVRPDDTEPEESAEEDSDVDVRIYEVDVNHGDGRAASVRPFDRAGGAAEPEDDEKTVVLTQKPPKAQPDFANLQFGDQYKANLKKK